MVNTLTRKKVFGQGFLVEDQKSLALKLDIKC